LKVGLRKVKPLEVLSRDEVETIHKSSLNILEEIGVKVYSDKALEILRNSGAHVNSDKKVATLPSYLVEEALRKCPKTVRLGARNPKLDVTIDGRHVYGTTDGAGTITIDLESGERRLPTKEDVAKTAIIGDSLEYINMYYTCVTPMDVPKNLHILHEYDAAVNNTEKHFISGATDDPEATSYLVKMAAAVVGDKEELRKRPIVSSVACMASPLIVPAEAIDPSLILGQYGLPVEVMTMPIAGANGPITVAGSVLVGNAQFLAGNTILQLGNPGAPIMYSSYPLSMDLKTGAFSVAFPEVALITTGHIQMARYYGLPSYGGGTISSAKIPDEHAAYEKATNALFCTLAGSDVCGTIGLLENYSVLSYEQMLIDYEMYTMILKMLEGITIDDDALALEAIHKAGHEGHFLTQKHTLLHSRESWVPTLTDARPYATWKEAGAKSVVEKAREKAKQILKTHKPEPLDPSTREKLTELIHNAEKKVTVTA
jgi:trimethylamine--corrinoid protein Co-methyltransferase